MRNKFKANVGIYQITRISIPLIFIPTTIRSFYRKNLYQYSHPLSPASFFCHCKLQLPTFLQIIKPAEASFFSSNSL